MTADRRAAIPAVAALAGCGLLTAVVVFKNASPSVDSLRRQADAAAAAGDDRKALLLQQHLLALGPDDPRRVLDMARTLDRLGRRREAMAVLATVTPENAPGYAPAHLLLAEWIVDARVTAGADAAAIESAKRHAAAAALDPTTAARAAELAHILDGM